MLTTTHYLRYVILCYIIAAPQSGASSPSSCSWSPRSRTARRSVHLSLSLYIYIYIERERYTHIRTHTYIHICVAHRATCTDAEKVEKGKPNGYACKGPPHTYIRTYIHT